MNNSFVDRLVKIQKIITPKTATTKPERHTIIITNSNKTSTGQPQGRARKMSRRRNPQRKETRKKKERIQVTEKFIAVLCMESQ